jgi:hypothetical protein
MAIKLLAPERGALTQINHAENHAVIASGLKCLAVFHQWGGVRSEQ